MKRAAPRVSCCVLRKTFAISTWLLGAPPDADAANSPAQTSSHTSVMPDGTITVHGLSEREVRHTVEQLTRTPWYEQVARWDTSLCPVIIGLPEPFKSIVFDHIQNTAASIMGRRPQHCDENNAIIAVTPDGTATFNTIYREIPSLGRGSGTVNYSKSDRNAPDKDTVDLLRQDRPVRWYRGVTSGPANGIISTFANLPDGARVSGTENLGERGVLTQKNTTARVSSLIVIIDLPKSAGPTWGQLADYIAFVTLASPGLGEPFSTASIMSLFNDGHFQPDAPKRLTSFDTAMLQSLYKATDDVDAHDEQAEIANTVTHVLARQNTLTP